MAGRTDRMRPAARAGDARPPPTSWSSSGPPGCATTSAPCTGPWRSRPWCSPTAPTPTSSRSPRTSSRPRCRCSTCAAAGSAASAAGSWRRSRTLTTGDLVEHFCSQVYGGEAERTAATCPARSWCPRCRPTREALADWLSELRGARVSLRVPQRGDKRALLETVARNAGQALAQHKLRRAGDLTTRSQALEEIAGGARAGRRRRCGSSASTSRNLQGTDVVASHGGVRGRAGPQERVPPVHHPRRDGTDDVSAISRGARAGASAGYLDERPARLGRS